MRRLAPLPIKKMNEQQSQLFQTLTAGKRGIGRSLNDFLDSRGGMRGPFNALLHHPSIGNVVQRLGEILRFEGTLTDVQREVAILTVGRHWQAQYEWWAHEKIAADVGVPKMDIEAIKNQISLPSEDRDIIVIYEFVRELTELHRVTDESFDAAHAKLGDAGVVELVILVGYYGMISGVLNTFEVPLPHGIKSPFNT